MSTYNKKLKKKKKKRQGNKFIGQRFPQTQSIKISCVV